MDHQINGDQVRSRSLEKEGRERAEGLYFRVTLRPSFVCSISEDEKLGHGELVGGRRGEGLCRREGEFLNSLGYFCGILKALVARRMYS